MRGNVGSLKRDYVKFAMYKAFGKNVEFKKE